MGTRKPHGLRLPLCPYCEGRFLYGDVRRHIRDKTGVCPNCGKRFIIRAKGRIVLLWCIAGVLLCCLFPLHPFVVRYRRLQDPLPPGRRRGADGKKGGKTG